ncbi:sulfur-oxidizing protein SoxZ [Gammaproteobacteria bacterium]
MASNTIKVRAQLNGDIATIKALITHPMESGMRKDTKTGEIVPAHFIEEVVCSLNGKTILTALWSGSVSKNPYLAFNVQGAKAGDTVGMKWKDNKGDTDSVESNIAG